MSQVKISMLANGIEYPPFYCEEGGSLLAIARTLDALSVRFECQETSDDGIRYTRGSGYGFDGSHIQFLALIEGKRGRRKAISPVTL